MKQILAPIFILLLAGGGYFGYQYYFQSPEKILVKATQQFSNLKTVHAEMEVSGTTRLTQNNTTLSSKISGFTDINIPDKTQKMHMTVNSNGQSFDMDIILLKAGEMYMKMPALGQIWISLNTKTLKDQGRLPIDPQSNDYVTQSIGFLKSVDKGSIVKLEDETVDGIKANKFRVDISTPKYLEFLKAQNVNQSFIDSTKDATIKSTIWIAKGSSNVIAVETEVKNVKVYTPGTTNYLGSADSTVEVNYSRYNQTTDVSKPTGEIVSYEDLLKKLGGVKGLSTFQSPK